MGVVEKTSYPTWMLKFLYRKELVILQTKIQLLKKWYPKNDYKLKVKIIIQIFLGKTSGKQPFFPIAHLNFRPMIWI